MIFKKHSRPGKAKKKIRRKIQFKGCKKGIVIDPYLRLPASLMLGKHYVNCPSFSPIIEAQQSPFRGGKS
jgi:hypothetical protein